MHRDEHKANIGRDTVEHLSNLYGVQRLDSLLNKSMLNFAEAGSGGQGDALWSSSLIRSRLLHYGIWGFLTVFGFYYTP